MKQNPDDLFNTNIDGLLKFVCELAKDCFNEMEYQIKSDNAILNFPKMETFIFTCDYSKHECYLETTKNNHKYKLIIPVDGINPTNQEYLGIMTDVFLTEFYAMYSKIETLAQPGHYYSLPYKIEEII